MNGDWGRSSVEQSLGGEVGRYPDGGWRRKGFVEKGAWQGRNGVRQGYTGGLREEVEGREAREADCQRQQMPT